MADSRILHRRASTGARIAALSHLEYRVWTQYLLSADDYGVMPAYAHILQGANPALRREPTETVQQALEQVVGIELVRRFDHQGEQFVWQPTWQEFQRIKHPRNTVYPPPPIERLGEADPETRKLFRNHHPIAKKHSGNNSEKIPPLARAAHARNTNTNTTTARQGGAGGFDRFWAAYPNKVAKVAARQAWTKLAPTEALVERILAALAGQARSPKWREDQGRFIPHPASWLNKRRWEDEGVSLPDRPALPRIPSDVVVVCEAAGIKRHDIESWFQTASITRDHATGIVRLIVESDDDRAWITRHYVEAIEAAIIARGGSKLVLAGPDPSAAAVLQEVHR